MYLEKRRDSTIWSMVHDIAKPLRPYFGRHRLTQSLGVCRDRDEALAKAAPIWEQWQQELAAAKRGEAPKEVAVRKLYQAKAEGLAWETKSLPFMEGDRRVFKPVHILRCAEDGCTTKLVVHAPPNMPPEQLRNKFAQKGWEVHIHQKRLTRCPVHSGRRLANPALPAEAIMKMEERKAEENRKRQAEAHARLVEHGKALGKKRWEGTTPEQRSEQMRELALKRGRDSLEEERQRQAALAAQYGKSPPEHEPKPVVEPPEAPQHSGVAQTGLQKLIAEEWRTKVAEEHSKLERLTDRLKEEAPSEWRASPKELRVLMALLDRHFDVEAGRYNRPWSDQSIADEAKIPVAFVRQFRDEAFGPLKTSPEVLALRDELRTMRGEIEVFSGLIEQASKAFQELANGV